MIRSSTEWVDNVSVEAVEDTLQSNGFWTTLLTGYQVTRVVEVKCASNGWDRVWDYVQKNHLLQKAISLYLADVLDLKSRNAQYEVLEKTKTAQTTKSQLKTAVCESSCSTMDSVCSDDDENDVCNGKVNRFNVEVLLLLNEWVPIKPAVYFKHETVAPHIRNLRRLLSRSPP